MAHKTGSITEIRHDGGIVYRNGGPAYVLVVLTRGIADADVADRLIADISRIVAEEAGLETIQAGAPSAGDRAQLAAAPRIAITVDDLPWNGPPPPDGASAATRRLLSALAARGAPATGFVVCSRVADDDGALRLWLEQGLELGSHSEAHRDLNDAPLALWLDDVRSCDRTLRRVTGGPVRFFRFPYLHQGPTSERRAAALDVLGELGYSVAHVTVDNSEYILARPYDAALSRGDEVARRQILGLFVEHLLTMTLHYQEVARRKLGRDVSHILLLHANALVADGMARLLDALAAERFEIISLEEALTDPVYALPDAYVGRRGLSWLYRVEPLTTEDAVFDDQRAAELRASLTDVGG